MATTTPNFYKGRPILQPGETYLVDGEPLTVITATVAIVSEEADSIRMTEEIFWLEHQETGERTNMKRSELESKFKEA